MSVAEIKIEVINKITAIENETLLKEVLAMLSEKNEMQVRSLSISKAYEDIKNQYGDVLQKLAQ